MSQLSDRVHGMIDHIKSGKILEAMNEFYAPDVMMQENTKDPCVGLQANIEREKQFLAQVKDWHGFEATAVGIDEANQSALVESWMEFTNQEGQKVRLEQVSVTHWKDGKIVRERFYYDSAG